MDKGISEWRSARWVLLITTAVVAIGLLWFAKAQPTVCPAIYPAPSSCSAEAREAPALVGTVAVTVLFVACAIVMLTVPVRPRRMVFNLLFTAMVLCAIVGFIVTLFAAGFGIPLSF